jgi:hypothetical protein
MDIVQITDTASYGTPKAQEETLVQCACEEGIVQIRRKSLGEPYELTLLPRAPDLYLPRKTCRTTLFDGPAPGTDGTIRLCMAV